MYIRNAWIVRWYMGYGGSTRDRMLASPDPSTICSFKNSGKSYFLSSISISKSGCCGFTLPMCRSDRKRIIETRSEEHTSELQSRGHLVCRLLLEKKKKKK